MLGEEPINPFRDPESDKTDTRRESGADVNSIADFSKRVGEVFGLVEFVHGEGKSQAVSMEPNMKLFQQTLETAKSKQVAGESVVDLTEQERLALELDEQLKTATKNMHKSPVRGVEPQE